jgi:ubiquinone/menaquinone biosynthesis C-methylase UbiE
VNELHLQFLASPEWGKWLETELLPWIEASGDLGDDVLEVGPGPGLTTDLLRERASHVTAVELDEDLARALSERLEGTNVTVVRGDATELGVEDDRFSAATCFSMLHHVPDSETQDRVFAELNRVLRPGGRVLIVDSLDAEAIRSFHEGDVFVPMALDSLGARLEAAGFTDPVIETTQFELRARATKPGNDRSAGFEPATSGL